MIKSIGAIIRERSGSIMRDDVTWFMGSFGNFNLGQDSWLAKVENTDPQLGIPQVTGFKQVFIPILYLSF